MLGLKRIFYIAIVVGAIIFNYSCEKIILQDEPLSAADSIKFSTDIKPIFASCIGCHDASRAPNLKDNPYQSLKTGGYINISHPSESNLYVQLKTKSSHSSKVSPSQLKKILDWITQGAKNN